MVAADVGNKWNLGEDTIYVSNKEFWEFARDNWLYRDGYVIPGKERCIDFEWKIWFGLGKTMFNNHYSLFNNWLRYVHNENTKPYKVIIINYTEYMHWFFDFDKYLSPTIKKGEEHHESGWIDIYDYFRENDMQGCQVYYP